MAVSAANLCVIAFALVSLFAFTSQAQPVAEHSSLIGQLREAKLKLAQLESDFEHISGDVEARDRRLEESGNRIEEMEKELVDLQATLTQLKDVISARDREFTAMEKEIRNYWDTLRKSNFDIHVMKLRAVEYDTKLDALTSLVEKTEDIVAERWIQIQQFEQALQLIQMRLTNARRQARYSRCTFLKYMNYLNGKYVSKAIQTVKRLYMNDLKGKYVSKAIQSSERLVFGEESGFKPYISYTVKQLKRFYSTVKEFHFELQSLIRQILEDYEYTECLANDEVVFFVASALIVFPVLYAWVFLSSHLR